MKINKDQALELSKILHIHLGEGLLFNGSEKSKHRQILEDLQLRLEGFLLGDQDDQDEEDDCCESDDEDDEADDEEGTEDEQELEPDSSASGQELHNLKAVKSQGVALEFEGIDEDEGSRVYVLVDSYPEHIATHIRRLSKSISIRDEFDTWRTYNVSRFPKGWADLLPLGELVEVES